MRRRIATLGVFVLLVSSAGDRGLACGGGDWPLLFVNVIVPVNVTAFNAGHLGIVQPTYAREYLAKAYRRFTGVASRPEADTRQPDISTNVVQVWLDARQNFSAGAAPLPATVVEQYRVENYSHYVNCGADAFTTAAATLRERAAKAGRDSQAVRDWIEAQDAVFSQCGTEPSGSMPAALPADAAPWRRADRAYQLAAAHFYKGDHAEAERRFRAISEDGGSPWRVHGKYLAARALIRQANRWREEDPERSREFFARAERELRGILEDRTLEPVHARTQQLLGFVSIRTRPMERVHELSRVLATAPLVTAQEWIDFRWLMDGFLGDRTDYGYEEIPQREVLADDDLIDWILAMQGTGAVAGGRAFSRWQQTRTIHWLVAALWDTEPTAPNTPELLAAAADVPRDSPAYHTLTFLRVRALTARGDRRSARQILSSALQTLDASTPVEAANLFAAQALLLAGSLEEVLRHLPRTSTVLALSYGTLDPLDSAEARVGIDRDGALLLAERLPLGSLVAGVRANTLPPQLHWQLAAISFARAVLLRDGQAGQVSATALRRYEPKMAEDLRAYLRAADDVSRHRAGIFILAKYPGFRPFVVPGEAEPYELGAAQSRESWWCGFGRPSGAYRSHALHAFSWVSTPLPQLTSLSDNMPVPEFLSPLERGQLARELAALAALGTGPNYVLREAVAWARAMPSDPRVPEVLARAIRNTRSACGDEQTASFASKAFALLHARYPKSVWARRTRYWYDGRS